MNGQPQEDPDEGLCGARTRSGGHCRRPKARGRPRCRLHGGARGSGAPAGDRNGQYRHGEFTKQAIIEKRWVRSLLRTLLGSKGADHE